jgi:molybdopterin-guanine dinucleotide biosynthesis protein
MCVRMDVVCSATRRTRVCEYQQVGEPGGPCAVGDVVVGRVADVGRHSVIETEQGVERRIRTGDCCAVVLGRRYSTTEFYGDIPGRLSPGDRFDLLNVGGIAGRVIPEASAVFNPTVLTYIGHATDRAGTKLTTFDNPIAPNAPGAAPAVILVIGSSMDSGKTTTAAFIIQMLTNMGFRVGGGKLTGTSRMKDLFRMKTSGAVDTVDFLDAGWPSTCGLSSEELEAVHRLLVGELSGRGVDVIVTEAADGIFEPETEKILRSRRIMGDVTMTVACAIDSVSAYGMITYLENAYGIVPDFISGIITSLPLFMDELSQRVTVPFFADSQPVRKRCRQLIVKGGTGVR